jgi:Large ribosomal RNA subunit accumulation protein YceD
LPAVFWRGPGDLGGDGAFAPLAAGVMVPIEPKARSVVVEPWPSGGIELTLEATPEERRMLASRFDLVGVERLVGHASLDRIGEVVRLRGRLEAQVVQSCVISLEDVRSTVDEAFECRFTRPGAGVPDDLAWDQDIEPLEGTELDVGEIFAQQLALALDPYPRAADAYALVSRELGSNIAFGEDGRNGALAVVMVDEEQGAAHTAPPGQGRG